MTPEKSLPGHQAGFAVLKNPSHEGVVRAAMTLLLVINALSASAARPGASHFVSFYELNQGQRMLHLHFEYLERTHDGYLLTEEPS